MSEGKLRRLRRIFGEDGSAVIVAMDHGGYFGAQPGLEQPRAVIRQVVAGGADAILTTLGLAQNFADELAPTALLLRVDGGVSKLGTRAWRGGQIFRAETALRLGADGVVAMGFPGSENENKNLHDLAQLSEQCVEWGLPLMAEMLPRGFEGGDDARAAETLALAMRIGAELGADIIKTQYTGSVASFQKAVSSCYVPVVVLGGPKMEDEAATLRTAREAMDAGARGVAMGRNIWNHPQPQKITAAIAAIVHQNASVAQAIEMLK
jgi:DhnA family fructose-bisphosphate aldolase class Ia